MSAARKVKRAVDQSKQPVAIRTARAPKTPSVLKKADGVRIIHDTFRLVVTESGQSYAWALGDDEKVYFWNPAEGGIWSPNWNPEA